MRSGFKGFGFLGALMAASFATAFMKPRKSTPAPLLQQPSRWGSSRDGWKVKCHKSNDERLHSLAPFIAQYNANSMNFLPGRITAKLYRLDEKKMLRAASAELANLKRQTPNMRISTYGSHPKTNA